ncbi:hypothetical protein V6N13_143118 [Hibiscus sabdariffa]|uniref:Uncharacterized protein n=1 Tax=Hibiscus sabdariffa TaxID=183260 RepID=A0ABR2FGA6_9ROSI
MEGNEGRWDGNRASKFFGKGGFDAFLQVLTSSIVQRKKEATKNSWLEFLIHGSMDKGRGSKGLGEDGFMQILDSPSRPSALFYPHSQMVMSPIGSGTNGEDKLMSLS